MAPQRPGRETAETDGCTGAGIGPSPRSAVMVAAAAAAAEGRSMRDRGLILSEEERAARRNDALFSKHVSDGDTEWLQQFMIETSDSAEVKRCVNLMSGGLTMLMLAIDVGPG